MPKHTFLLVSLLVLSFQGCIRKAEIPAYIRIENLSLNTDIGREGAAATGATDVWVYMDNSLQGVYELPCDFPVIGSGTHQFRFWAGIKRSGQSADRAFYPLYLPLDTALTLSPDHKHLINPVFHFQPTAVFVWKEDFETSGITMRKTGQSTIDSVYRLPGWHGTMSATDTLTQNDVLDMAAVDPFTLPGNGTETYLEFSYKAEVPVEVGMFVQSAAGVERYPLLVAYASPDWKHLHLRITEDVGGQLSKKGACTFKPYVYASNASDTAKTVWWDNLKLLHR